MRPRRLVRSPFVFWLGAATLAALTALIVSRITSEAAELASRYGPLLPVVVAAREVDMGTELAPADVEVRQLPAGFVPGVSVSRVGDAVGRTALGPLVRGELILAPHLAPEGLRGIAALLPPGARAVAVPAGGASAPVRRGDVVDVLATFDPSVTGGGDPTFPVAVGARVVEADPDLATIAVGPEEALAVAFAVANGSVTLAVVSPVPGTGGVPTAAAPTQPALGGSGQRRPAAATTTTATPATTR